MRMRPAFLLCLTGLAACAPTARVSHFQAMGELGQNYERAVAAAIDKSKGAQVDATSVRLLEQRGLVGADERTAWRTEGAAILSQAETADLATIAALNRIIVQARLLERYFTALTALAAFDGETAMSSAAQETTGALSSLIPELATAQIGGATLPQFVSATTPIIVGALKSRPLERELRERGPVLLSHLRWQKQLLTFLADRVAADNALIARIDARTALYLPYSDITQPVTGFRTARREQILAADSDPTGLRAAAALSDKLHDAILALAEGRLAPTDLASHMQDVSRLAGIVEGIAGKAKEPTP